MRTCPGCHARNGDHSTFCIRCGASLAGESPRERAGHTDAFPVQPEDTPRLLVDQAAAQLADGQAQAAIDNCRRAIVLNPREMEAFAVLGMAFEQTGDLQSALDAYETVLSLAPERAVERQKAALLRLRLGHQTAPPPRREAGGRLTCAGVWEVIRQKVQENPAVSAGLAAGLLVFVMGAILLVHAGRAQAAAEQQARYEEQVTLADQALAEQRYADATAHYKAAYDLNPADAQMRGRWEQAYRLSDIQARAYAREQEIAATPKYIPNLTGRNPFSPVPIKPSAAIPPPGQEAAVAPAAPAIPVPPPTVHNPPRATYDTVSGGPRQMPPSTSPKVSDRREVGGNAIITPVATKPASKPAAATGGTETVLKPSQGEVTIWASQKPPSPPAAAAESRPAPANHDADNLRRQGEQLARDGRTGDAISTLERAANAYEDHARHNPGAAAASSQAASSCRARIEVLRQSDR